MTFMETNDFLSQFQDGLGGGGPGGVASCKAEGQTQKVFAF